MEFDFNGKTYRIGKLDAFSQLHVARKLGPSMPLIDGMVKPENASKDLSLLTLIALGGINDADCEYIVRKCLSVVMIKQETGWANLADKSGSLMFDDTPMQALLQIATKVIEENLGDFFRTALSGLDRAENQ